MSHHIRPIMTIDSQILRMKRWRNAAITLLFLSLPATIAPWSGPIWGFCALISGTGALLIVMHTSERVGALDQQWKSGHP